jgi:hypothetical protein
MVKRKKLLTVLNVVATLKRLTPVRVSRFTIGLVPSL